MSEPLEPQVLPPTDDLPADKGDAWDAIIDTVLDEESGQLSLVTADPPAEPADKPAEAPATEPAAPEAPQLPTAGGDPELRAWATRLAQQNAEIRKELDAIKGKDAIVEAAQDSEGFIERLAQALPEDFHEAVTDRRKFARIVTTVAERIASKATKSLSEQVTALESGIASMSRAQEFIASASPAVQELVPHVREIAEAYAQHFGKNVFDDYSIADVLQVAQHNREQSRLQASATTAPGQAPIAPPPAAPSPSAPARPPVTPAQRAAAHEGVSVSGDDVRSLGRQPVQGPGSFNSNLRSVIEDVIGEAAGGGA